MTRSQRCTTFLTKLPARLLSPSPRGVEVVDVEARPLATDAVVGLPPMVLVVDVVVHPAAVGEAVLQVEGEAERVDVDVGEEHPLQLVGQRKHIGFRSKPRHV
jgi:hypothetical protein